MELGSTWSHVHVSSPHTGPRRSGPPDPLSSQPYYHGVISRVEAEALLENEGEFLVRESSKIACQFVLTGMSHEGPQHLLLMDKTGRVGVYSTMGVVPCIA